MGLFAAGLGFVFFPFMFKLLTYTIHKYNWHGLTKADVYTISMRLVSALQGMMACAAGMAAMANCSDDILHSTYWTVDFYTWFALPYFYYDVWAMYVCYRLRKPELQVIPHSEAFPIFVNKNPLMMAHHILFPLMYFPIIAFFRNGKGDFFVGCLLNVELAIPCISLRGILLQLGQDRSQLYMVNGILMICTFAVCRVLIFPFLYWVYARYSGLSFFAVPLSIPMICNVGCVMVSMLQVYWLWGMVKAALKFLNKQAAGAEAAVADGKQPVAAVGSKKSKEENEAKTENKKEL